MSRLCIRVSVEVRINFWIPGDDCKLMDVSAGDRIRSCAAAVCTLKLRHPSSPSLLSTGVHKDSIQQNCICQVPRTNLDLISGLAFNKYKVSGRNTFFFFFLTSVR